ncbi:unnamed protein product [Polarella glacialis]|uniref:Uncharacterized protein n=1 Tax=Polarella glacialis TaxID=89957 RepID=A0A813GJ07_POLGL|nr:unnamed protein product [Polarella glacialis]
MFCGRNTGRSFHGSCGHIISVRTLRNLHPFYRHCPGSTPALHRETFDMAMAGSVSVEGPVKAPKKRQQVTTGCFALISSFCGASVFRKAERVQALQFSTGVRLDCPKKFSSIAGNWKMCNGQHPEELLSVHRHFSANSSVAGPSKSLLGLFAGAPYYLFVSEDLQVAKSMIGRIATHTWRLDGSEQIVGRPLGFCPALFRCSQVDSQCLRMELKQGTEIIELKFQLGETSTVAQWQFTLLGSKRIVFDAQFVRVKALPSNVGSQGHSSARRLAGPVPFESGLESSTEAESAEDEGMDS